MAEGEVTEVEAGRFHELRGQMCQYGERKEATVHKIKVPGKRRYRGNLKKIPLSACA